MSKLPHAALLALLAALFIGCGPSLVQRGDRAMLLRDPAQAAQFYVQALADNPKLASDPTFTAKLNRAQSLAHCSMGRHLADAGRWDEAVAAFQDAVRADADLPQAAEGLTWAKGEAAKVHLTSSFAFADKGKLDDAVSELSAAARYDPQNVDVQQALAFAHHAPIIATSQAQVLFERALRQEGEKRLGKMAATLGEALAADPRHIPARVALARVRSAMARAARHVTTASAYLSARKPDTAQAELDKAIAIWPFYHEATQLLNRVRTKLAEAESLAKQARSLSDQGKWEEAVRVASASLNIFPAHPEARILRENARQNAAAAFIASGRSRLQQGALDDAAAQFQQALHYLPNAAEARAGLAAVDTRRGQDAEQRGLWGNALIWHLRAADHLASTETTDRIAIARSHILARTRYGLHVTVATDRMAGDATLLRQHVQSALDGARSEVLTVLQAGADPQLPVYRATVRLGALTIQEKRVQSVRHTYRYTVRREVANPDIPPLREALLAAQHDFVRLEHEYHRPCRRCDADGWERCDKCRGRGRYRCSWCKGSTRMPCRKCKGKKKVDGKTCSSCNGSGKRKCGACHGGYRKCSKCDGKGKEECDHCDGTGRDSHVSDFQLRRAHDRVHDLRMELHRQPLTIMAAFPAEWPYTIHFHEKHGSAEAHIEIASPFPGQKATRDTVVQTSVSKDALVENANPSIDLQPNPLILPADATTRQWLVSHLAAATAERLRNLAVAARAAELEARAAALDQQGKHAESIEATVDLTRVIQETRPSESDAILKRLKQSIGK